MKKICTALMVSALALAACGDSTPDPAPMPADPLTQQLVNKTLTSPGLTLSLLEANRLVGRVSGGAGGNSERINGAWEIREGRFCRTIDDPSQIAGTTCNSISIDGETATIGGANGPTTFIISDT